MFGDDATVHGLLGTEAMKQICNNLPHLWKIYSQVFLGCVFSETRFEDFSQVFGHGHEVGHIDIERGKCGHSCVKVIAQTYIDVADLRLGHLQITPESERFEELLDCHEETRNRRLDSRMCVRTTIA